MLTREQLSQRYIVVCSDTKAGKDSDGIDVNDLSISPTTDPSKIAKKDLRKKLTKEQLFLHLSIFKRNQKSSKLGSPVFDLVICDEAHRTTGIEGSQTKKRKQNV